MTSGTDKQWRAALAVVEAGGPITHYWQDTASEHPTTWYRETIG